MTHHRPLIAVHGGAGSRAITTTQRRCLADALVAGYAVLGEGHGALHAVELTIRMLESSGLFNAGVGARLQLDGATRMDAAIMEGRRLRAGAVAGIEGVRHPITAARYVMEHTPHVLLVGPPATRFARHFKLERQRRARGKPHTGASPGSDTHAGQALQLHRAMQRGKHQGLETVGAVALDCRGTIAAGASTGGIACMLPGRVGDTPLIGCGVYADDEAGAVSMTGVGEGIIRIAVAKEIVDGLAGGRSPASAVRSVLHKLMTRIRTTAGALVITPTGRLIIRHTSRHMAAGRWNGRGKPAVGDQFT